MADDQSEHVLAIPLISNPNPAPAVSKKALFAWSLLEIVYLAALVLNFTVQDSESWTAYAFRLTQVGAWLSFFQHLLHPYSSVRPALMKVADRCKLGYGRWKCIKEDDYTHSEGFSNLALVTESLIPTLYWALAYRLDNVTKPIHYANTIMMHGVISLMILADYFINSRTFHLRHTLVNLSLFMALYMAWNLAGQKAQKDPIYPVIDWEKEPQNVFLIFIIALVCTLFISGALKCGLTLREEKCPPITKCTALCFNRQQSPEQQDNYQLVTGV